jgi:hypothetical protein
MTLSPESVDDISQFHRLRKRHHPNGSGLHKLANNFRVVGNALRMVDASIAHFQRGIVISNRPSKSGRMSTTNGDPSPA